jgi:asparagine synthase (glutamine-hydrolysing)
VPGLFGIVRREPDPAIGRTFDRLSGGGVSGRLHVERRIDEDQRWAIGRTHLGVLQPAPQLGGDGGAFVLLHGDLDNGEELAAGRHEVPRGDAAAVVRARYREDGVRIVSRLRGSHCTAILDTASHELTLVADRIGSYPLYWSLTDDGLVFASEMRAIARSGMASDLNPAAVADCLTFGFPMGTKTLARGVELVAPGSALTYCWRTGQLSIARYASLADGFTPWTGTKEDFLEALATAFRAAVGRSLHGAHAFGLALSGGLDSRAILSALNGHASSLTTYTLGADGCADQVIADRLASLAGTRHLFFELNDRYLADFLPNLERTIELTDGMYVSHGLTEMLALGLIQQTGIEVLVRGHGGELAKTSTAWPFHTDERTRAMRTGRELVPYLLERMNYITAGVDVDALFTPAWARDIRGCARASLEAAVRDVDLAPADTCTYLYVTEHHRRSSIPSLELFRSVVEVRLPFLDEAFRTLLLSAPSAWREGFEIHRTLTAKHNPSLLRVRNANTGAAADAGPLVEAALDKVNTLLRRLNVRGYRHYHRFDAWMREQLVHQVQTVLLDRQSLDRGMYEAQTLRRVIDDTRSGAADHSFLLLVLLILELWQRRQS